MVRTIREHEKAEALDLRDREGRPEGEAERQRRRRLREVEDEDTLRDEPVVDLPAQSVIIASVPPDDPGDDLKCERVQDRGPGPCDDEG